MSSRARKRAKNRGVSALMDTLVSPRPSPKVWTEGPPAGEPHWWVVPDTPERMRYPGGTEGPYVTLRGWCRPTGGHRYDVTEEEICGHEIEVEVQLTVTPLTNGIRVWYPEMNGTWYWQSSHFKNTLLNDPDFYALVEPMLCYAIPGRDERGVLLADPPNNQEEPPP